MDPYQTEPSHSEKPQCCLFLAGDDNALIIVFQSMIGLMSLESEQILNIESIAMRFVPCLNRLYISFLSESLGLNSILI